MTYSCFLVAPETKGATGAAQRKAWDKKRCQQNVISKQAPLSPVCLLVS